VQGHPHHRAHRARHVGRPREGTRGGLRRLRHEAHRAAAAARQDRSAARLQASGMTAASGGDGPSKADSGAPASRGPAVKDSRAKGALLAHMRHELRTPVNAILGYSEMLIEDEEPGSGGAVADLQKIQAAGHTLL